jgi:hypothetical protein
MSLKMLEIITDSLIPQYPGNKEWKDSKFDWIRALPPGSKGVVGKSIGSGLLQGYGLTPMAHRNYLTVNGQTILPRMAMKWAKNIIKFQNIRDVGFEHVLCFAIYPKNAFAWMIPKTEIWVDHAIRTDRKGITSQHKGADAWIHVDPENPQKWLNPYGGTIEQAMKVAKTAL